MDVAYSRALELQLHSEHSINAVPRTTHWRMRGLICLLYNITYGITLACLLLFTFDNSDRRMTLDEYLFCPIPMCAVCVILLSLLMDQWR